jgi:hypothetical protein
MFALWADRGDTARAKSSLPYSNWPTTPGRIGFWDRCLIQTGPLPPAGLAFGLQLQPHASYSLIIDGQELHKEARQ